MYCRTKPGGERQLVGSCQSSQRSLHKIICGCDHCESLFPVQSQRGGDRVVSASRRNELEEHGPERRLEFVCLQNT